MHDVSLNKKGRKIGRRLSCYKMFVDWVRLVRTGKCLVFGHGAQTPLPLVFTLWVKAKYFLFDPPMLSISMSDYTTFLEEWKFTEMQCENVHVVFFSDCLYQVRMDPFQLLLVKQSLQPGSKLTDFQPGVIQYHQRTTPVLLQIMIQMHCMITIHQLLFHLASVTVEKFLLLHLSLPWERSLKKGTNLWYGIFNLLVMVYLLFLFTCPLSGNEGRWEHAAKFV